MRTRSLSFLALAPLISVLLCGCLASKAPLITASIGDRPLPAHFLITPDDDQLKSAMVDLAADNSYRVASLPEDKMEIFEETVVFKKISDDIYAYSRPETDKNTGAVERYVYGYMRILDDDRIVTSEPDCADFDRSEVKKLGVEATQDEKFPTCYVPSVEVLLTLIGNYLNDPKNAEKIKSRESKAGFHITRR